MRLWIKHNPPLINTTFPVARANHGWDYIASTQTIVMFGGYGAQYANSDHTEHQVFELYFYFCFYFSFSHSFTNKE